MPAVQETIHEGETGQLEVELEFQLPQAILTSKVLKYSLQTNWDSLKLPVFLFQAFAFVHIQETSKVYPSRLTESGAPKN